MADDPNTTADPSGNGGAPPGAQPVNIEDEVRRSFLDYSMSVIISRALPDVRDGLKPVHRRILFAMHQEGLLPGRNYSKSAGVVGEVLKHYHPHGDSAVYDSMVRMAQDFSLRYPLVDGQGNFGSIDGDSAAAYRYTEARLTRLAEEMLRDIERDTVDFVPNFDGTVEEPVVLPASFPNLLANGSSGIAVGMATNVPPHNLRELIDALVHEARHPDCTLDDLLQRLPGPDFPTGAIICGSEGIRSAYATGRGSISVRARASFEEDRRGKRIVVTEIPFMVNKATLQERIADLVREGRIDGVTDIRDESNRQGIRVVIEVRRDAPEEVILNQLYVQTPLQTTFGVNLLALANGRPKLLSLKEALRHFIDFRGEVVVRRATYDLAQARARAHLLEGFAVALDNLDAVIAIIRAADDTADARAQLMARFELSELQTNAILEMRLRSLTQLERGRVMAELAEVRAKIVDLEGLLESDERVLDVIVSEIEEIREKYGDERRTEIGPPVVGLTTEDLIVEEEMAVTVSHLGYIKRTPLTQYRAQRRGGKGVKGAGAGEQDFVQQLFSASTHAFILFFTTRGRVHWLKVHELPLLGRLARGRALVNVLQLAEGERVRATLPVRSFEEASGDFVLLGTKRGVVKKTPLPAFSNPRRGGIIAINLGDDDELIAALRTNGHQQVLIATEQGKAIRFPEEQVRAMGRTAAGVRGISLRPSNHVVGMEILSPGATILTATENGYGKRTPLDDYRLQGRGGQGVITIRTSARNGAVVGVAQVLGDDEVMFITNAGQTLRCRVDTISTMGRAVQGVRLMGLSPGEKVVSMARLAERDEIEEGGDSGDPDGDAGDADGDAGDADSDSGESGGDSSED
ncbi:MAG: DNA gyrase subunit A [Myxococcales bacterium]|nr:MAG: DNA gyrase subunit A [Myxococcales bacterium]